MPGLTEQERTAFTELAKSLTPDDKAKRGREDAYAATVVKVMHEQFTDTDDVTIARICHVVAFIMFKFAKMNVCELHLGIENMLVSYGLAAASLAGVYELGADAASLPDDVARDAERHVAPLVGQYL